MCLRVFYLGDRPELSSRDGASVRATLSRGRANHNDVTPYDPNIRTHLIRAVPELAQERVETATRVPRRTRRSHCAPRLTAWPKKWGESDEPRGRRARGRVLRTLRPRRHGPRPRGAQGERRCRPGRRPLGFLQDARLLRTRRARGARGRRPVLRELKDPPPR